MSIKKNFNCDHLKRDVQITWTPAIGVGGEKREKERKGVGLVSTLNCDAKDHCKKTPTGPGCPFTQKNARALKDEWLNQE